MKKGWEYKKLGEVAKICGGRRVPKGCKLQSEPTSHKYIRVADFLDNGTICKDNIQYITDDIFAQIKRYTISSDDVYISIAGTIGKSGIVPDELDGANLTENACKLVLNKELDKRFIYLVTTSPFFKEQINTLTKKSAQPKLALTRLATVNVPTPPLSEQKEIVEYLDSSFAKIDKLKANAAKNLEEAKALFQSALKDALEPKEGWEEKKMVDVCTIERGGSPRPIKKFLTKEENGVNWIKIGDTDPQGKYIYSTSEKIIPEGLKKSRWVDIDDFLLSNSMSFGRPYILKTNGCIHDGWLVLRNYQKFMNIDFFYYLLSSPLVQSQFKMKAQGSTVSNLNTQRVADVTVYIPPFQEQQSIVSFLDSLNERVNTLQQNYSRICNECDALKQAILRQVFE